jgi:predicted MFS family arabinose efflux permease
MAKLLIDIARTYRHLPASVYLLFLTDVTLSAGNFVFPFLTLYLTLQLGLRGDQVGLLMGACTASCLAGTLVGGYLADTCSRKAVVLWSMVASALAYSLVPFCAAPHLICTFIVLGLGIMAVSKPAYNALVADFTGSVQRKAAFSLLYLGANVGFAVGPVLGSLLYDHCVGLLFVADAAMTLAAAGLVYFLLDDRGTQYRRSLALSRTRAGRGETVWSKTCELWSLLRREPLLLIFTLVYTAHIVIYSQIFFALPLYLSSLFGPAGPHRYGLMMTLNGLSVIAVTPLLTHATRKLSSGANVTLGGLLFAVGFGGYYYAAHTWTMFGLVIVWTLGEVLSKTNAQVFIAERALPCDRGRLNVLLELAHEIGFGLGPVVAGVIILRHGVGAVWPWAAGVGVAVSAVMAGALWGQLGGNAHGSPAFDELPAE